MKVVIRAKAEDDLDAIAAWIAKDNPKAAAKAVFGIRDRIAQLEHTSLANVGHVGTVSGTREIIERPYIIVYKLYKKRDEIAILAIVHAARERQ
jgi:plasmid stabilization system protein ParE